MVAGTGYAGVPFTLGHHLQRVARHHRQGRDELAGASRERGPRRRRPCGRQDADCGACAHGASRGQVRTRCGSDPWLEEYTCHRPGHILMQKLAQELGCRPDPAPVWTVSRTGSLDVPGHRQQIVGVLYGPAPQNGRCVQGQFQAA